MITALIDGDIILWRTATSIKDVNDSYQLYQRINTLIYKIQYTLQTDDVRIFITGKEKPNYRNLINPLYKENRKNIIKPDWFNDCKDYLLNTYEAIEIQGYEADDALGWNQTNNTVICTIDKDLQMIPGKHYNFITNTFFVVTELEAIQFFYKQMLIGDTVDNIQGINLIGPKKADKLISPLQTEQEMFDVVYNKYNNPRRFLMNAQCLWIQQERNKSWVNRHSLNFPDLFKQEVDQMLEFMISLNQDI
jgi:5'-3' exonuclease